MPSEPSDGDFACEVVVNIARLTVDRLRIAIRSQRISFPSQVPVFSCQTRPDIQWRLSALFFVHNWSINDLASRYVLSAGYVRRLIGLWARRAAALGYLQEIPATEAPIDLRGRGRAAPRSAPSQTVLVQRVSSNEWEIDLEERIVSAAGNDVRLTPTEWTILEILVSQVNRTVPRYHLVELLKDTQPKGVHCLRHFVKNLRQKLEPDPEKPRYLITEPTIGYRLQIPIMSLSTPETPKV